MDRHKTSTSNYYLTICQSSNINGKARITKGDEIYPVHEYESLYVPKLIKHRVENPGKVELHIIEIQTGGYVEEDDIERFDDENK